MANRVQSPKITRRQFLQASAVAGIVIATSRYSRLAAMGVPQVVVSCESKLEDAAKVTDFMSAGGAMDIVAGDSDNPITKAWKDVGMRWIAFDDISAETEQSRRLIVNQNGEIDFTDWDKHLDNFLNTLGAWPFMFMGNVPRALSSNPDADNYATSMPRDLAQWQQFVTNITDHNVKRGLGSLFYGVVGKPESDGMWLYPGEDKSKQLRNSIELYAATYRGIKAADPNANVGAPGTMNWKIAKYTESAVFSLEDWLKELAQYNAEQGENAVGLDHVEWQDFGWASQHVWQGIEAVKGYLQNAGFDPNTYKVVGTAINGGFGTDPYDETILPHQRASQLAHNIIHEAKDPRTRQIGLPIYSFFWTSEQWWTPEQAEYDKQYKRSALVVQLQDGSLYFNPTYAVFQMINAMTKGSILETTYPHILEAMAVRTDETSTLIATLCNHNPNYLTVDVVFNDIPFKTSKVSRELQMIDAIHTADGNRLEPPTQETLDIVQKKVTVQVVMTPYSTAQIKLRPIQ